MGLNFFRAVGQISELPSCSTMNKKQSSSDILSLTAIIVFTINIHTLIPHCVLSFHPVCFPHLNLNFSIVWPLQSGQPFLLHKIQHSRPQFRLTFHKLNKNLIKQMSPSARKLLIYSRKKAILQCSESME